MLRCYVYLSCTNQSQRAHLKTTKSLKTKTHTRCLPALTALSALRQSYWERRRWLQIGRKKCQKTRKATEAEGELRRKKDNHKKGSKGVWASTSQHLPMFTESWAALHFNYLTAGRVPPVSLSSSPPLFPWHHKPLPKNCVKIHTSQFSAIRHT